MILHHEEHVDLIPANIELADFEMRLVSVINREQTLSNCIEPLRNQYDYIFIDCPPSLGMLTVNALSAADEVLIPVQTQYLPAKGMTKLLQTVGKVQRKINSNLKFRSYKHPWIITTTTTRYHSFRNNKFSIYVSNYCPHCFIIIFDNKTIKMPYT